MILFFSGTGNSQYTAQKLCLEGETLLDMGAAVKAGNLEVELPEGERLGFVFPVYYGGLPTVVKKFASEMKLSNVPSYVFSVITCGGDIYGAGKMLSDVLRKRDLELESVYSLLMPDNCVILYTLHPEKEDAILAAAETEIENIKEKLVAAEKTALSKGVFANLVTSALYPFYEHGRKTDKFWTDESCISCGTCERRCPENAIKLIDGKVTWVKDRCAQCMSCVRCNAIQYGKKTMKQYRYKHPMHRKAKSCH